MIDRDIDKLNDLFGGITSMNHLPGAIFSRPKEGAHCCCGSYQSKYSSYCPCQS